MRTKHLPILKRLIMLELLVTGPQEKQEFIADLKDQIETANCYGEIEEAQQWEIEKAIESLIQNEIIRESTGNTYDEKIIGCVVLNL